MTEFNVGNSLEVTVDQRSLRDARDEIQEEVGDIALSVNTGGSSGGGAGASMLQDIGDDTTELVDLAGDRNDILEDILDELQDASTGPGGGLFRGRGGGGGGGGGGGIGIGLPTGLLAALGLGAAGAGAASGSGSGSGGGPLIPPIPNPFGGGAPSAGGQRPTDPSQAPGRGRPGGIPDPFETPDVGPGAFAAGAAGLFGASQLARSAGQAGRSGAGGAAGAATGGFFGVGANELQSLDDLLGITDRTDIPGTSSRGGTASAATGTTQSVATTGSQPAAQRPQSVTVNPTITVQVGGQGGLQQAIDQAFDDIQNQLKREIERSVVADIENTITNAGRNLGF
jgi:hypothetical protein